MQAANGEGGADFRLAVPENLRSGVYANFMSVWFTPYELTLDFSVIEGDRSEDVADDDRVPCLLVSRVKIPATLVFDVLQTLNRLMTAYEARFGELRPPQAGGDS